MPDELKSHRHGSMRGLGGLFAPKTISFRSGGADHSITLGRGKQLTAAGIATGIVLGCAYTTIAAISERPEGRAGAAAQERELAELEAELARAHAQVAGLSEAIEQKVDRLEEQQKFLASLLAGDGTAELASTSLPRPDEGEEHAALPATPAVAALMAPLRELEAGQLAFVDQALVATRARLKETQALVRQLGLDPSRLVRQTGVAMGGPLESVASDGGVGQSGDPRFTDLFISWKKLDLLEKAVSTIPSAMPVRTFAYTSDFGVRYDPFTGHAAQHAGIDMAGRSGEPIYASADGEVEQAGWAGSYGNMIEVAHGNGITTRYAHLSRILVRPGDRLKQGELIAKMGSTGRSTGTHLHYEVRVDGRAVNPMPFLKKGGALLALQERGLSARGGPEEAPASAVR